MSNCLSNVGLPSLPIAHYSSASITPHLSTDPGVYNAEHYSKGFSCWCIDGNGLFDILDYKDENLKRTSTSHTLTVKVKG